MMICLQDPASSSIGYDEETEGLIQSDGARPSTSRGVRDDEDSSTDDKSKLIKNKDQEEKDDKKKTETSAKKKMIMDKLMMIPTFISSVLVSLTLRLHRISRSYRYVMRVLAREKKTLKVCWSQIMQKFY
jgi:hypothetical protein